MNITCPSCLSCVSHVGLPPAILDRYLELLVEGSADFAFAGRALQLKEIISGSASSSTKKVAASFVCGVVQGRILTLVTRLMESKRAT
jgi:hypothetical protein